MIYIVNGSGPSNDGDYAVEMAGSHCWVLYFMNKSNAYYWRGPGMFDCFPNTAAIADKVFDELMKSEFPTSLSAPGTRPRPKSNIYLIGYSRGGAAVLKIAQMLARQDIPVTAMFLFDAVDQSTIRGLDSVPANVVKCYHAVRNEGAQVVMETEERQLWKMCQQAKGFSDIKTEFARIGSGSFETFLQLRSKAFPELNRAVLKWQKKAAMLKHFKVAMRNRFNTGLNGAGPSIPFGNCATDLSKVKEIRQRAEFAGSHGALGGVPWENIGDDVAAMERETSRQVWSWMSSKMLECGLRAGRA